MSRSFYVGEQVQQEDIHAKFEDGILRLTVPKEVKNRWKTTNTFPSKDNNDKIAYI